VLLQRKGFLLELEQIERQMSGQQREIQLIIVIIRSLIAQLQTIGRHIYVGCHCGKESMAPTG
jgi:hypothetical protein